MYTAYPDVTAQWAPLTQSRDKVAAGRRADPFVVILPACMYVKSLLLLQERCLLTFVPISSLSLSLSPDFFASHFPAPDVSEWKNGGGGGEGREREKQM